MLSRPRLHRQSWQRSFGYVRFLLGIVALVWANDLIALGALEGNGELLVPTRIVEGPDGNIYAFGNPVNGSQFRYNADYGAMLFEVYSDSIVCKFINRSGSVIDNYTLLFFGIPVELTGFNSPITNNVIVTI